MGALWAQQNELRLVFDQVLRLAFVAPNAGLCHTQCWPLSYPMLAFVTPRAILVQCYHPLDGVSAVSMQLLETAGRLA